jgi:hypothetical protein
MATKKALQKTKKNEMPELQEFKGVTKGQLIGQLMIVRQQVGELSSYISTAHLEDARKQQVIEDLKRNLDSAVRRMDATDAEKSRLRDNLYKTTAHYRHIAQTLVFLLADMSTPGELLEDFKKVHCHLGSPEEQELNLARGIIAEGIQEWVMEQDLNKDNEKNKDPHTMVLNLPEIPRLPNGEIDVAKASEIIKRYLA